MSEPRVGFCGLGTMGGAMAANVARAGFPLTPWNRTPGRAVAEIVAEGMVLAMKSGLDPERVAATPAGGAAGSWVLQNRSGCMAVQVEAGLVAQAHGDERPLGPRSGHPRVERDRMTTVWP